MFGILEWLFLFIAVYFAFMVARKLKGGAFGLGMQYLAWSFGVMAIGHLHMQIAHYTGFDLFSSLLGANIGGVAWVLALAVTWGRSEEHTSELQSLMRISYAVFCLKKKQKQTNKN